MADRKKKENVILFYTDFLEETELLTDTEVGRLVRAIIQFKATGEVDSEKLTGNERFVFATYKRRIMRENDLSQKRADAGGKGGLEKAARDRETKELLAKMQGIINEMQGLTANTSPDESLLQQNLAKENLQDTSIYNTNQDTNQDGTPLLSTNTETYNNHQPYAREEETGGGGGGIHDELLKKFSDTLGRLTRANTQEFNAFADIFPEEVMLYALNEAGANGKLTWAYVRGILNRIAGQGLRTLEEVQAADKKRAASPITPAAPSNPALNYPQRDYKPDEFGEDFFFDPLAHGYGEGGANA